MVFSFANGKCRPIFVLRLDYEEPQDFQQKMAWLQFFWVVLSVVLAKYCCIWRRFRCVTWRLNIDILQWHIHWKRILLTQQRMQPLKAYQTVITSWLVVTSRLVCFGAVPRERDAEQVMTQSGSQWLTAVTSSPVTGAVIELQSTHQRTRYDDDNIGGSIVVFPVIFNCRVTDLNNHWLTEYFTR